MDAADDAGIYAREVEYLERFVQFGEASSRVIAVSCPETPDDDATGEHDLLDRFDRYFEGIQEVDFTDVTIGLTLPTDQRDVLQALRQVGYGEQVDVKTLGNMTPGLDAEDDDDLITVRQALADNPVPILVPDHRVRDGPSALPPPIEQKLRALEEL
jgi:methylated-DNA-[protein]-cysteine S-methyltransferase